MLLTLMATALAQQAPPIVNGDKTSDFVSVGVLIAYSESRGGANFCSGTLIHSEWVVTAAHCNAAAKDYQRGGFDIYFGWGEDLRNIEGWAVADQVLLHPDYNPERLYHDIGLLHLEEPVTELEPVLLNTEPIDESWYGDPIVFVGWGATSDSGGGTGTKRWTAADIYDANQYYFRAYERGTNLCQGDSGGAGLKDLGDEDYRLAGINSFVFAVESANTSCVGGGSGSTRVDANLEWIEQYVPLGELNWGDFEVALGDSAQFEDTGNPERPMDIGVVAVEPKGCAAAPTRFTTLGGLALLGLLLYGRRERS